MLDLKKMTYINEDGLRVTDSRIIQKEFGIRQHAKVMRTIRAIIERDNDMMQSPILWDAFEVPSEALQSFNNIETLFIESTYESKSGRNAIIAKKKYEITEEGFYVLMSHLRSSRKDGQIKLHYLRRKFVSAFFTLREELNKMLKAYKILAEQFLPIDERGGILC